MSSNLPGLLSGLVAVATLPLGILVALFAGPKMAAVVFVVGWLLLVPTIALVGEEILPAVRESSDAENAENATPDPLAELKARYARGELTDEEFERRMSNLVETEDVTLDRDRDLDFEQVGKQKPERVRE
ncbi:SHOCT domain-containing protein [Halorussus gelatinilyticus]|uniref:SHOCT domain-containing protein n=1 Tax=Halorussus gelatinilyticus TaxID=2937524 RepID=A0A8U0IDQ0_9EURY|nr:SHOCT domain-containing protein [Halorussus gelatinilyticus]UPV99072.1 SHOCT domain-containing protein [Halorussus gelatinilyticus]